MFTRSEILNSIAKCKQRHPFETVNAAMRSCIVRNLCSCNTKHEFKQAIMNETGLTSSGFDRNVACKFAMESKSWN